MRPKPQLSEPTATSQEPAYGDLSIAKEQMQQRLRESIDDLDEPSPSPEERKEIENDLDAELLSGPRSRADSAINALTVARRNFVEEAQRQLNPTSSTA